MEGKVGGGGMEGVLMMMRIRVNSRESQEKNPRKTN